jgi:hypothetical protein
MYTAEKEEHIIKKGDYEENKDSALFKLEFINSLMKYRNQAK